MCIVIPVSIMTTPPKKPRALDPLRPFLQGGIAGVSSWLVIHPADVVKVRLQLGGARYSGTLAAFKAIAAEGGVRSLYSGLSAALTRQVTYTTLRLGLYSSLKERWSGDAPTGLGMKLAVGCVSGGIASAVSTPVEVSMVRMYNDGSLPARDRRNYKHVGDALVTIARGEGVRGLWRGAGPTIARSMVVNCVQLGTYDQATEVFRSVGIRALESGVPLHLAASLTSGLLYSIATLPIDSAKTRLQNQRALPDGTFAYRNMLQTLAKISRDEGLLALWRGFAPYFSRCGGYVQLIVVACLYRDVLLTRVLFVRCIDTPLRCFWRLNR